MYHRVLLLIILSWWPQQCNNDYYPTLSLWGSDFEHCFIGQVLRSEYPALMFVFFLGQIPFLDIHQNSVPSPCPADKTHYSGFRLIFFVFGISLVNRLSRYCLCLGSVLPWSQLWLGSIFIQFGVKLTEKWQFLCWWIKKFDELFALCRHVASSSDCNNGPNIVIIYY